MFEARNRASELDDRPLKPVANAEIRYPVLARPSRGRGHAFGAPGAEAAGWARLELGVELNREKPRVIRYLRDLDELAVGAHAGDLEAVFGQVREVFLVDLITVAMALADFGDVVDL